MNLPPEFIHNIEGTFGEAGKQFLAALPAAIDEAAQRWCLTAVQPVPTLSYNFAAFARRGDEQVVLKMGVPNRELKSEMAALRSFNGEGACRLIDYDEEKCWLLLERLKPGTMLLALEDDEEATHIAAELAQKIWKPLASASLLANSQEEIQSQKQVSPRRHGDASRLQSFIRLSDWFNGLQRLRAKFNGGTGPFNEKLVERVKRSVRDFFVENHKPVLMHGDFHHYNILSSGRDWKVIDPKGVIGPACYEVGPFLLNPWGELLKLDQHRRMTERRIDILHEHLGFERERICEWGLAHAILSSWWSMESHSEWRYASAFAEVLAGLPIS